MVKKVKLAIPQISIIFLGWNLLNRITRHARYPEMPPSATLSACPNNSPVNSDVHCIVSSFMYRSGKGKNWWEKKGTLRFK